MAAADKSQSVRCSGNSALDPPGQPVGRTGVRLRGIVEGDKMARTAVKADSAPPSEDFAAMLDESLGQSQGFEGAVVQGRVVGLANDFVIVDVGLKSEGRIPLREFSNGGPAANINV